MTLGNEGNEGKVRLNGGRKRSREALGALGGSEWEGGERGRELFWSMI